MYAGLDVVDKLRPEAEKFVLENDRMLFAPFFAAAEKFFVDNNVVVGGKIGIDLLTNNTTITKDSFVWDVYTDDTFATAKELADSLSKVESSHIPARTVALQTSIRHREFIIYVNTRLLFKIYSMDKYRGLQLISVMGPVKRKGYFSDAILNVIPEEIQLIDIYRTLYSPSKSKFWSLDIETEEIIYNQIRDSIEEKATEITGGARFNRPACDQILIHKIIATSSNVLIGDYALSLIAEKSASINPSRLQFISDVPIEDLVSRIEKVLTSDKNAARKIGVDRVKISSVKYNIHIPSDFQITKHTLYAIVGQDQTPIADVFNSTTYEMIPYWIVSYDGKNIKIGNPFVLLKYQFIDIWILKLIMNIGNEKKEFLKTRIKSLILHTDYLRELVKKLMASNVEKLFQLENYEGININELTAKKKLIKEIGERFANYYPAQKE
jgi:hypothetical protein